MGQAIRSVQMSGKSKVRMEKGQRQIQWLASWQEKKKFLENSEYPATKVKKLTKIWDRSQLPVALYTGFSL